MVAAILISHTIIIIKESSKYFKQQATGIRDIKWILSIHLSKGLFTTEQQQQNAEL